MTSLLAIPLAVFFMCVIYLINRAIYIGWLRNREKNAVPKPPKANTQPLDSVVIRAPEPVRTGYADEIKPRRQPTDIKVETFNRYRGANTTNDSVSYNTTSDNNLLATAVIYGAISPTSQSDCTPSYSSSDNSSSSRSSYDSSSSSSYDSSSSSSCDSSSF